MAPSASGVGSSPGATGSPITGAAGMNTLSGSAVGLVVVGGIALVSLVFSSLNMVTSADPVC